MSAHLRALHYFWHEKGDPERYVDADSAFAAHPEMARRRQRVKDATADFENTLDKAVSELEDEE